MTDREKNELLERIAKLERQVGELSDRLKIMEMKTVLPVPAPPVPDPVPVVPQNPYPVIPQYPYYVPPKYPASWWTTNQGFGQTGG